MKRLLTAAGCIGLAALAGCKHGVLDPKGPTAFAELQILVDSTGIMLAIVVPTIIATLGVAFWFRASNGRARYRPEFEDSGRLELFWVANTKLLWPQGIPLGLAVLAIAQMGVHLVFFLHITSGPDNTNNALALAFGVLVVTLIVTGSLVIVNDLKMMPGMTMAP
jgi:hypothetical protein